MDETFEKLLDDPEGWLTTIQQWLVEHHRTTLIWIIVALIILLVFRSLTRRLVRGIRRRRPAQIHPSLAKYNVDHAEVDRRRRQQSKLIIATSTGTRLVGYRIVRQVEAVFVEGFRTPDDALVALKSAAADQGANGLLNVRTERTAAGRCTAAADAVVIVPLTASGRAKPPDVPPRP